MGSNSRKCIGYRRKAKFAPGALLRGTTQDNPWKPKRIVHLIVLNVEKVKSAADGSTLFRYKVLEKESNNIQYLAPMFVERFEQIDLLNIGNLRILLDDAPSDGPDEARAPSPNPPLREVGLKKKA